MILKTTAPALLGPAPLTIQFKDLSTKMEDTTHTSWAWDFQNDGSTDSTSQNPSFIYTANGTYTVKMTATNAGGSDSEIKTGYITVGTVTPPPVANFTATPRSGTPPLAVTFTDTSTNTPTSWKWAYKNATVGWTQFSTVQNPSYTFAAGTYDINLTATNAAGSDDEIKNGYITVSEAVSTPVANFTATPGAERHLCGDIHRYIHKHPDFLEMGIQECHPWLDAVFHGTEPCRIPSLREPTTSILQQQMPLAVMMK